MQKSFLRKPLIKVPGGTLGEFCWGPRRYSPITPRRRYRRYSCRILVKGSVRNLEWISSRNPRDNSQQSLTEHRKIPEGYPEANPRKLSMESLDYLLEQYRKKISDNPPGIKWKIQCETALVLRVIYFEEESNMYRSLGEIFRGISERILNFQANPNHWRSSWDDKFSPSLQVCIPP